MFFAVLFLLLLAHSCRGHSSFWVADLLWAPVLISILPISKFLPHAAGGCSLPIHSWPSWRTCKTEETYVSSRNDFIFSLVLRSLGKCNNRQESAQNDEQREMVIGHHLQIYLFGVVECLSFESVVRPICTAAGKIDSQSCLLPNWPCWEAQGVINGVILWLSHLLFNFWVVRVCLFMGSISCDKGQCKYLPTLVILGSPEQ